MNVVKNELFVDKKVSSARCTELSDSLRGSDGVVPPLPSSSGKQFFHPPSLENGYKHENQAFA